MRTLTLLCVSESQSEHCACRIDPLDFAKESVGLLDLIDRLTLGQPILQPPAQGSGGYGGRQPGAAPGEAHYATFPYLTVNHRCGLVWQHYPQHHLSIGWAPLWRRSPPIITVRWWWQQ